MSLSCYGALEIVGLLLLLLLLLLRYEMPAIEAVVTNQRRLVVLVYTMVF